MRGAGSWGPLPGARGRAGFARGVQTAHLARPASGVQRAKARPNHRRDGRRGVHSLTTHARDVRGPITDLSLCAERRLGSEQKHSGAGGPTLCTAAAEDGRAGLSGTRTTAFSTSPRCPRNSCQRRRPSERHRRRSPRTCRPPWSLTQQLDCQGGHVRHTCRGFAPPSRTVHGPTRVCDHTRVVSSPHEVPPTKPRHASKFSGAESKPSAVAPSCFPNRLFLVQGGKE